MRFLRDLPVNTKAILASVILVASVAGFGGYALVAVHHANSGLGELYSSNLNKVRQFRDAATDILMVHADVFRFVALSHNPSNSHKLEPLRAEIEVEMADLALRLDALRALPDLSPDHRKALTVSAQNWGHYIHMAKDVLNTSTFEPSLGTSMFDHLDTVFQDATTYVQRLARLSSRETHQAVLGLKARAETATQVMLVGVLITIAFVLLVVSAMSASVIAPIRQVTTAMRAVAGGENAAIPVLARNDEIGQMLKAVSVFKKALEIRESDLRAQNMRFDAAVNNIPQGLVMYDADHLLIVCNRRYAEMYALPPELTRPATPREAILEHRKKTGSAHVGADTFLGKTAAQRGSGLHHRVLSDGRVIAVSYQPLASGGYVATHEDITARVEAEAQVAHMARHDALTGLPNRVVLRAELERGSNASSAGSRWPFCVSTSISSSR